MFRLPLALLVLLIPMTAGAQAPPTTLTADPAQQKAQAAFEALPEAERRQIQLDLNFAADFSGAAQGTFGPLTYRALIQFERLNKSGVDGVLDSAERAALAAAAKREREKLGFRQVIDPVTKAGIGLPLTLLTRSEPQPGSGTRWQTADGKATVATRLPAPSEGTLEQIYEKAIISQNPQRKVTYKLLRPDFFVVAGETPQGRFFQRMAKLPDGGLRGFSVAYDKALSPAWDKLTVAAANTFAPEGQAAAAAQPARAATAAVAAPPPNPFAPRTFERSLTGVTVGAGRVLTASAAFRACAQPRVAGQPASLVAEDASSGLVLVQANVLSAPSLSAAGAAASVNGSVTVLMRGQTPDGARGLMALPGEAEGKILSAPLQPGAAGAPAFGPDGRLAGIVTSDPSARLQVAGVVLSARHQMAGAEAVAQFLKIHGVVSAAPGAVPAPSGLGGIAARHGASVVAISCGP
jgi:peptidoglycan hydrolase-like protein with peptidoglycan-binding domain